MRVLIAGFVLLCLPAATAQAQTSGAPPGTTVSAADVAAIMARAKAERKADQPMTAQSMIRLAPYNVNLEYRVATANASVHETEAELFYVIDGSATMVTGGRLTNATRNGSNLTGSGIEGGLSRKVAKGDFIMVPEGTPHWFSAVDGTVVLMSLHLPHAPEGR